MSKRRYVCKVCKFECTAGSDELTVPYACPYSFKYPEWKVQVDAPAEPEKIGAIKGPKEPEEIDEIDVVRALGEPVPEDRVTVYTGFMPIGYVYVGEFELQDWSPCHPYIYEGTMYGTRREVENRFGQRVKVIGIRSDSESIPSYVARLIPKGYAFLRTDNVGNTYDCEACIWNDKFWDDTGDAYRAYEYNVDSDDGNCAVLIKVPD